MEQSISLAERLRDVKIDSIYSSPLVRATSTARPIAELKRLKVISRKELAEIDFGRWEGLTLAQVRESFPDELEKCRLDPRRYGFRYGMEYAEVEKTVSAFLLECVHTSGFDNIAVISHSVILKMIIMTIIGLPSDFIHSFRLDNCSVSVLCNKGDVNENKYIILKINDTGKID